MRSRLALATATSALALAMAVPAQAYADSAPSEVGSFVSDNVQYVVGALVAAILLLLLIVSINQRRGKEKAQKQGTGIPGVPPATPRSAPGAARPPAAASAQTAELPATPS